MSNDLQGIKNVQGKTLKNDTNVYTNNQQSDVRSEYPNQFEDSKNKKHVKEIKLFGGICVVVSILAFIFSPSVKTDNSESAKNALKNRVSTAISAGTVLLVKDENVPAKDYVLTHKSDAKETKIWIWDYAAEEGDYVQVLVNGSPVTEAFMIMHKPREITVPAMGEIQIKGIRDGGGGITYAVRYEVNKTSYFNGISEGAFNTYTLTKE